MPSGYNTTSTLADSLDDIKDSARAVREYANVMGKLVDMNRLPNNTGLKWDEVALSRLTASNIDQLTDLELNPQQIVDTLFSVQPTEVGMSIFKTDLVDMRINSKVAGQIGVLTENAMARKKDLDLIAAAQTATTDLGTANNPMSSSLVSAAVARIKGNATEPWDGSIATVMTSFQLKDIQDEGVAGFGTYPTSPGMTETFMRKGYEGPLFGSSVYSDDNIAVDGSGDAIAVVFASGSGGALAHVEGMEARRKVVRKENIGVGAEILYATDQYGTGVRQQAWIYAITADSSSPS